ncbi:hypothetical protein [Lactobacillus johnsonii]|uniref:hypothetical protein n=1 Tax=Lactobacillus johnsonii TaxID=33959 RepID=UPI000B2F4F6A|nr:hypothetical protein [Lactobacillus johnsonii]
MKFKLFINPNSQEIVEATVHRKSDFSTQLEQFVLSNGNSNIIPAYDDKDLIMLNLDNIIMFTIIENKVFADCKIKLNT